MQYIQEMKVLLRNVGKITPTDAFGYQSEGGYDGLKKALEMNPSEIIQTIQEAGLRGRGGAGFPTHLKLQFAAATEADQKYIVCNADEGEPGTNKDRVLLTHDPHSIFEGMAIVARSIGADTGYIYLRAEYSYVLPVLENAIQSAIAAKCLGKNILGSDFNFEIRIRSGAGAYVCGEETALFESIEGRRGEPRYRPPYPGTKGLFGKPTVLNNVETLANIAPILKNGAPWYKTIGTEGSHGTKLFTICGNVKKRGVYEFPMGVNLKEIIYDVAGGLSDESSLLAVQTGGSSGAIINANQIDLPLDINHVSVSGGRLGCGTILVINNRNCIVDIVKNNLDFFRHESCGQCTPCREGGSRLYELVDRFTQGTARPQDIDTIIDLAETMKISALCGLGHSTAVPVLTSLRNFPRAYESHIDGDYCPVCSLNRRVQL